MLNITCVSFLTANPIVWIITKSSHIGPSSHKRTCRDYCTLLLKAWVLDETCAWYLSKLMRRKMTFPSTVTKCYLYSRENKAITLKALIILNILTISQHKMSQMPNRNCFWRLVLFSYCQWQGLHHAYQLLRSLKVI